MAIHFMAWLAPATEKIQQTHSEFEDDAVQAVDMDSAFLSLELQHESAQIMKENNDWVTTPRW